MPRADFFHQFGFLAIRDFLDPECRARLADEMREADRTSAAVCINGENVVDESKRSSWWAAVAEPTGALVRDRVLAVKPALEAHFNQELSALETLRFLFYEEGSFFGLHRDAQADGHGVLRDRKVGVVIFVNGEADDGSGPGGYRGGSLTFYELLPEAPWKAVGFPLAPEPGMLVAFPAHLMHEVRPVTQGVRLAVNTFYR